MKRTGKSASDIRRLYQWALTLVMAAALLLASSFTASAAADSPSLDWSWNGKSSITVELKDDDDDPVKDGTLTLYQVALLQQEDGDMVYTLTSAFADSGVSLDDVAADSASLASKLSAYVTANQISGTSVTNTNGTVVFSSLELGLYLIVQTTESSGYYTMNPFVVSVPLDVNDNWDYTVDASPKVGVLTPVPETEETETMSEESTPLTSASASSAAMTLPQTGQLNWPVPVLVLCGFLLIGLGSLMVYSDRRKAAGR